MKYLFFLLVLSLGFNLSTRGTDLSCELATKSLETEMNKSLARPTATAQIIWSELISKQIYDKRAKFLASEYDRAQKKFLRVLKRKARKSYKKGTNLDQSEDKKLMRLQDELNKASSKYNKYIIKNLRTSIAKETVKSNNDANFYNFNFSKDPLIQFKSNVFEDDLNIEKNQDLNLEFFDRKDTNGSLYAISIDPIETNKFLISKSGNESMALSDLVSQTIKDGFYYKIATVYEFEIGAKKPILKLKMSKHKNEDDPEILEYKNISQTELTEMVSSKNCSNGVAIRGIPRIVVEDDREEGKDLDESHLNTIKESTVKVQKD